MSSLTVLPTHHGGKCQGGNPFTLANHCYTLSILTLKEGTDNLWQEKSGTWQLKACTNMSGM